MTTPDHTFESAGVMPPNADAPCAPSRPTNSFSEGGESVPPTKAETRRGDILAAQDMEAIVNPVNCVGTMGKGLALQFAHRYPEILGPYRKACQEQTLTVENPQILMVSFHRMPRYVVNLATKIHWRNPSKLEYLETGLSDMYQQLSEREITSVGIPPLGAGLGGLPWGKVLPIMEKHAAQHPDIRTCIYLPR